MDALPIASLREGGGFCRRQKTEGACGPLCYDTQKALLLHNTRGLCYTAMQNYFPSAAFLSQAEITASIMAAGTALCSKVRTP